MAEKKSYMTFSRIKNKDLREVRQLQPEGWSDIIPEFEYYINNDFCFPVKVVDDKKITGIGSAIILKNTAWLAHIIVDRKYRGRGIGSQIVEYLLKIIREQSVDTCLLIATEPGLPVYQKTGFKIITEYVFLKRIKPWIAYADSKRILPYKSDYYSMITELDRKISGEDRKVLIDKFLKKSLVYVENNMVNGFFLPGLGEGLIIADTVEAGLELMKIKYSVYDKAILPADNYHGIEFLKQNGFMEADTKGTRMILGKNMTWRPEMIYSRIGGNFG